MWKVNGQTDRQTDGQTTDNKWSEKLTWTFGSGELKTTNLSDMSLKIEDTRPHINFSLYLNHSLSFEQTSPKDDLYPSFSIEIGPVVLEVKSLQTDRWQTKGYQKISLELSIQVR